ncbi:MAG: hypothetical protein HKN70_00915 [Gammaproteobacteria bacterium]|nr:hypothetical protein [Gammaproteobacteria bacterium]
MGAEQWHEDTRDEQLNSMLPLLLVLARRLHLLIGVPLLCAIVAVIYSLIADPIYTATARILPPQYNENTVMALRNQPGGDSQLGNSALTLKNPTDLFVGILNSRTIFDAVIEAHDLRSYYQEPIIGEVRKRLRRATDIRASKDGIVSVSVEDTDREIAAALANAYVDQFYAFSQSLARDQAARRNDFYQMALNSARQALNTADFELTEVEKLTGFTRLAGQDEAIVQAAAELQAQIAAREVQLRTMASYATPKNPDVRLIRRELLNLRNELARMHGAAQHSNGTTQPFVALGAAPDALLAHARGKRDVEYWENIVTLLGRFSELGKIDARRDMSLFQVLDRAIAPHDKSKPRTRVNALLALIGSGFACLLWVLVSAYVQQRRARSQRFDQQWRELISTVTRLPYHAEKKRVSS